MFLYIGHEELLTAIHFLRLTASLPSLPLKNAMMVFNGGPDLASEFRFEGLFSEVNLSLVFKVYVLRKTFEQILGSQLSNSSSYFSKLLVS